MKTIDSHTEGKNFYKVAAVIMIVLIAGGGLGFGWMFYGTAAGEDLDVGEDVEATE